MFAIAIRTTTAIAVCPTDGREGEDDATFYYSPRPGARIR